MRPRPQMPSEDAKVNILNRFEVRGETVATSFFAGLRGESFPNVDGSSRQQIIATCVQFEELRMVAEPDNPHDPCAVKVLRKSGEQIGYLDARLAREVNSDWRCFIASINGGTEQKPLRGVTLLIVCMGHSEAR